LTSAQLCCSLIRVKHTDAYSHVGGARYLSALTHVPYVAADQTRDYGVTDAEVEALNTVGY